MKKVFIYAAIFMAAMSSCSNDSESISQDGTNENGLYPIMMSVSNGNTSIQVDKTRGTGIVGDTSDNPKWYGEQLRMIMLNHNDLTAASDNGTENTMYNDAVNAIWNAQSGLMVSNKVYYYPAQGEFDFFGYHIDDAAIPNANEPILETTENQIHVPFEIDGTQDLMVAKAYIGVDSLSNTKEGNLNGRTYSAYAARRGVQPTLEFQHLLTQLNFNIIAAESVTNPITVNYITVKTNKVNGTLTVAYTENAIPNNKFEFINWNIAESPIILTLKDKISSSIANQKDSLTQNATLNATTELTTMGAGMLVAPGEDIYEGELSITQQLDGQEEPYTQPIQFKIRIADNNGNMPSQPGTAYNVNIILYGIQEINVTTELTKWETGNDIPVDPENEME